MIISIGWNWSTNQVEQHADGKKNEDSVAGGETSSQDLSKLEEETEEGDEPLKRKTKSIAEIYER